MAQRSGVELAIELMRMAVALLDRVDAAAAPVAAAHVQGAIDALGATTDGDLERAWARLDARPTSKADAQFWRRRGGATARPFAFSLTLRPSCRSPGASRRGRSPPSTRRRPQGGRAVVPNSSSAPPARAPSRRRFAAPRST